jgi:hypothetical protein
MIWLSVKRDFFIEISRFRLRENSTYEHTGFSGGLPYDDVEAFVWVKARIRESIPVVIDFYVDPPEECPPILAERMKYHFKAFRLATLYASHAAEELASIEYIAKKVHDESGSVELKKYLAETAAGKQSVSLNSWQSALYSCLSENEWFCEVRFRL